MNQRERNALDRYITGNYGEDQLRGQHDDMPDFPDSRCTICGEEDCLKDHSESELERDRR